METSKEGTRVALDPKTQELYALLEEEREKNKRLKEENQRLSQTRESSGKSDKKQDTKKTILNTKKKFALQEQLNEKKLQDEIISNQQSKINSLVESLSYNQEIQDLDSKSINELKAALDSLIEGREKRKEIIEKLTKKNQTLMDENEDLKFTRTKLAHDLRSLMSSILGTLSLSDLGETEAMESLIPLLKERCHVFINLLSAINDDAINIESIKITDITRLLKLTVDDENGEVQTDINGDDIVFSGDKAGLYDVVQNLINNSVKYSGLSLDELIIKIEVTQKGGNTIISVEDNGSGIPSQNQGKIFDLYNRAGLTDKNGKGIGLYMARKILEKHLGSIRYDDTFMDGARFVLELPST